MYCCVFTVSRQAAGKLPPDLRPVKPVMTPQIYDPPLESFCGGNKKALKVMARKAGMSPTGCYRN